MKNAAYNIMPDTENILKTMGEQIKMARLRRKLYATLVAERAGISRSTLWKVENGNPSVAVGIYAALTVPFYSLTFTFFMLYYMWLYMIFWGNCN